MKRVSALSLLLVAAALGATPAAYADPHVLGAEATRSLEELGRFVDSALAEQHLIIPDGPVTRRLATPSEFEDHAARHLSAMMAEATDETLQAEAEALFKLYKRLFPDEVAGWGDTTDEQYTYFYANVFPKIRAKAKILAAAASSSSSSSDTSTSSGKGGSGKSNGSTTSTSSSENDSSNSGTSAPGSGTPGSSGSSTSSTNSGKTSTSSSSSSTSKTSTPSTTTSTSKTSTPSTTTSTSTTTSSLFSVQSTSDVVEVSSSLSFFSNVYDTSIASDILALQDNTNNIQTVVESASGSSSSGSSDSTSSSGASTYTSPTVLEGYGTTTLNGRWRRFLGSGSSSSSSTASVDVLFCDVTGNAIWKWSAEDIPLVSSTNTSSSTTTIEVEADGLCSATTTTLAVSAYQSGCSLQNHPEGCGNVYYKGCGGMTVSPTSDKIVVARTGGRTLGVLSYVNTASGECQGQVVDAISTFRGRKFNSPTYAEFSNKGILYFTDSPFGLATSAADFDSDALDNSPEREIPFNGVYMLRNGSNQSVELVDCDMDRPNKIAFSPSQDKMYITNSRASNSYVKEFTLADDGSVSSSRVFFNFTAYPELDTDGGYANGIKTDDTGNVYVVVNKSVFIFTPNATLAGSIVSNQVLDSVALGVGRMFITGGFGIVAQTSGVSPAQAIAQMQTTCSAS